MTTRATKSVGRRVALAAVGLLLALAFVAVASAEEGEQADRSAPGVALWKLLAAGPSVSKPIATADVRHDTSPALRTIAPVFPSARQRVEAPENPARQVAPVQMPNGFDPGLQTAAPQAAMPALSVSFDGVNNRNGVLPPDTNGDVGKTQYVQTVNLSFAVYSKGGALLYGPANTNTLFSGFGGPCQSTNDGDPIAQYDQLADRWLISQFALPNFPSGPFYQCIAVSTTGDATGSYYRYQFKISDNLMNDYPKFGVWPDAYYASFNDFLNASSFTGVTAVAFERSQMLSGLPARAVMFVLGSSFYSMLPSDLDGLAAPPAGAPASFVQMDDNAWGYPQDQLEVWKFHVDWTTPSSSTFTQDPNLATNPFDSSLAGIPQPSTTVRLDDLSDRLMYRLAYRNFGDHEAMVVNHSVDVGSNLAGVRWYELRKTTGSWSIYQQGTFSPSSTHRWMGSLAMDKAGDIAAGYSASSSSLFPSIFYAGRLAGDPLGALSAESVLFSGSGSQTHSAARWGDYSSMSVDPTDDCTFWYTTEYLAQTGSAPWRTRVAAFKFPSCSGTVSGPTISGFTPTSGPVGTSVVISGSGFTGATSVKFNGTGAAYTVDSDAQITATVPSGATSGPISVTTPNGTATSAGSFTVTVPGAPTISGFTPTSGPVGTSVVISGTNFGGATSVKFNGTGATFTVNSGTQITATVPSGATSGPISVTTPNGTATSASFFTVTQPAPPPSISFFSPTAGRVGTIVTIYGRNFVGVTSVKLRSITAQFTVMSSTRIRATVPQMSPGFGHWQVTTPSGTATSAGWFRTFA